MKMRHVRLGKDVRIADAVTFKAGERVLVEEALSGDIIGLHNHGTIQIGDTFHGGGEPLLHRYPAFRPGAVPPHPPARPDEVQAAAEGAAAAVGGGLDAGLRADQLHGPDRRRRRSAAVRRRRLSPQGRVQGRGDLRARERLHGALGLLRDERKLEEFRRKAADQLSIDGGGYLSYLAPTRVNLSLMEERWPDIEFRATREH
jgi:peptide chain release factor 3